MDSIRKTSDAMLLGIQLAYPQADVANIITACGMIATAAMNKFAKSPADKRLLVESFVSKVYEVTAGA